jgi:hypothetical protein
MATGNSELLPVDSSRSGQSPTATAKPAFGSGLN